MAYIDYRTDNLTTTLEALLTYLKGKRRSKDKILANNWYITPATNNLHSVTFYRMTDVSDKRLQCSIVFGNRNVEGDKNFKSYKKISKYIKKLWKATDDLKEGYGFRVKDNVVYIYKYNHHHGK